MKKAFDYIVVGSGINSLCCAALLAKAGHRVCVLERNDYLGGCIKTAEITEEGFRHDVLSGWHPLFVTSPSYQALAADLARHGLVYLNSEKPTAVVNPGGEALVLSTSRERNTAVLNELCDGDGDRYAQTMTAMERDAELTFSLLTNELVSFATLRLLWREWRSRGSAGLSQFAGEAMASSRDWLCQHFRSDLARSLLAPWILHTGLGPEANFSGAMSRVLGFSLESAGMSVVKGGSDNLVHAFRGLIEEYGGELHVNTDVQRITVEDRRARGVECLQGHRDTQGRQSIQIEAKRAVICNVTPQQLYLSLLEPDWVPETVREQAANFRFGNACMQIHLALDQLPQWRDPQLDDVAMVHLSGGLDAVSLAVAQAQCGLLPAEPTIVVAQPTALDPSRAPEGKAILWIQLQELPSTIRGDAAGQIEAPGDGQWTQEIAERYADRIIARIGQHIPGLEGSIRCRVVLSPKDLESINVNLVGGDPYSGHCGMQQFLLWRPLKALKNHETPVRNLYHIGASTHPGPGLAGNSGYMVARGLLS
ncbi:phytoene desaturase family protein [Kineobactrum salinum]|uniref:Pyridine nucleotide-disulfide oxidoreductase domain-containing protein 2 n=1 Tax=Kineobactrum salinum TaxID=2708301 RepID=A0A6C0TZ78_9GAMM|nr:NAD(P)/FAD-dependent oxidoreductase [Kineobactrum salinum]QIB65120.1 NAD(P)/FAD-dependent oxidoreductase [Kineobactrum salinum]